MADAEAHRLAQAHARPPQGQAARDTRNAPRPPGTRASGNSGNSGDRRRSQQAARNPAAEAVARMRAQAADAASRPLLQSAAWKLAPAAMWIAVFVAIMFFGAAATWLVGLAFLGNLLFKLIGKAQGRSKS